MAAPTKDRVFGLGIDGAPYTLLRDLAARGVMPNLRRLIEGSGTFVQMDTSIPEISSVAWTSLFTGENPGVHGLFGFIDLRPGSYKMYFPNATSVRAPAVWDELGRRGRRSIVINMPSTYPAREIPGILIAGFVAISLEKAVYPPSLLPELKEMGYRIDVDTMAARKDVSVLVPDLRETLAKRIELVDRLLAREDWDFFSPVITGTDRLHHFLWTAYEDERHPYHAFFLEYYAAIDNFLGSLLDRLDGRTTFLLYSDHGFTGIVQEVHLNHWLEREGYLGFTSGEPKGFEEMRPESRAFCLDPSRIYIHTEGRWPQGSVSPGAEREALIAELSEKLARLSGEDGQPLVQRIYRAEDLYQGPQAAYGPDLVLVARYGYDLKGALGRKSLFGRSPLVGMHTQDDAVFYSSRKLDLAGKMKITRIKDVILEAIG